MLAAECTCAMLRAEHSVLRQSLTALAEAVRFGAACDLERVRMLMDFIYVFQHACHRPKEVDHLLAALKGKSSQADLLIDTLEEALGNADAMLESAFVSLRALEREDGHAQWGQLRRSLERYSSAVLQHLATEEATLFAFARDLLGVDEWSRIASALSRVAYPNDALYLLDRPVPSAEDGEAELVRTVTPTPWPQAALPGALRH